METIKKLPDAEFEIMQIVWQFAAPVTINELVNVLNQRKQKIWKPQTVHTLLCRLVSRGFLETQKLGKERKFSAVIKQDEYLQFETESFVKQYYGGSRLNLINTMYQGEELGQRDIEEIMQWLNEKKREKK